MFRMTRANRPGSLLRDTWRAHTLRFGAPLAPDYSAAVGLRMLVAFLGVAVGLFFALRLGFDATGVRGLPAMNLLFVTALLLAFVLAQRLFVGAPLAEAGLRPFAQWTRLERLYLVQVVPMALVVFGLLFRTHLLALLERHGLPGFLLFSVLTGLIWGMVQELLYRGWLQTELTRRFGAVAGLLVANIVFTLGPLHFNALFADDGVRWGSMAAIFGIGLLFGVLYHRSGNLWIPAVPHGLWPLNMV